VSTEERFRTPVPETHALIEAGRLIADWLGRAVNGPPFGENPHPFYGYRLPGPVEEAMRLLTGSHDEQVEP
jgi:hypothetical protein